MEIYYLQVTIIVFSGLQHLSKITRSRKVEAVFLQLLGCDAFG